VVSQAVIFFEHWVRTRAKLSNSLIGVELMAAAFKAGAPLALANGEVASESEGWHLLVLGLAKAVRNVAGHRIEDRSDGRTYAMGVLGTVSPMMTQVRLEHPA
jgi:predicted MFS family arabinose efflux permease